MNYVFSDGPFSVSFRFFGVLPRNEGAVSLDRLHMIVMTRRGGAGLCPMFTPKVTRPIALIGEEIKL